MKQEGKKEEGHDVFYGRAHPDSDVGIMLKFGHHRRAFHFDGSVGTLPGDRHCEDCGARCGSAAAAQLCPSAEVVHIDVLRAETAKVINSLAGPKAARKVQRMFRRSVERETDRAVNARLEELNALVKDRPNYIPRFAWNWIRGLVLRDKIEV